MQLKYSRFESGLNRCADWEGAIAKRCFWTRSGTLVGIPLYGETLIQQWKTQVANYSGRYVMADLQSGSPDILTTFPQGDLALFRSCELAAVLNRMRSLDME